MELTVQTCVIYFLVMTKLHAPEMAPITTHPICFPLSNIQFSAAESVTHCFLVCTHTRPHQQVSRLRKAVLAFGNDNFNSFLSRYALLSYLFKLVMK